MKKKHVVGLVDIISCQRMLHIPQNGAIHSIVEIIKAVISSSAKAKLGSLYVNARKGVEERQILIKMGHPQLPTPI